MGIRAYKPTSPARRFYTVSDFKEITTDVPEINLRQNLRRWVRRFDPTRSVIERVKSFPRNVDVTAIQTYEVDSIPAAPGDTPDQSVNSLTMLMHYSMVLLPDQVMQPRLCDDRVGFFNLTFEDYFEWQSANLQRKQSNAGLIVAFAGFLSLGLGYTILRSSPERNDFLLSGGAFLFGGLLLYFSFLGSHSRESPFIFSAFSAVFSPIRTLVKV